MQIKDEEYHFQLFYRKGNHSNGEKFNDTCLWGVARVNSKHRFSDRHRYRVYYAKFLFNSKVDEKIPVASPDNHKLANQM